MESVNKFLRRYKKKSVTSKNLQQIKNQPANNNSQQAVKSVFSSSVPKEGTGLLAGGLSGIISQNNSEINNAIGKIFNDSAPKEGTGLSAENSQNNSVINNAFEEIFNNSALQPQELRPTDLMNMNNISVQKYAHPAMPSDF